MLLLLGGAQSVRQTAHDALFVALLVDRQHVSDASRAGFDYGGVDFAFFAAAESANSFKHLVYSYFGADAFSYGSTIANWREIRQQTYRLCLLLR